jgi:hypothetical protein
MNTVDKLTRRGDTGSQIHAIASSFFMLKIPSTTSRKTNMFVSTMLLPKQSLTYQGWRPRNKCSDRMAQWYLLQVHIAFAGPVMDVEMTIIYSAQLMIMRQRDQF